jgi:hypothetical protein
VHESSVRHQRIKVCFACSVLCCALTAAPSTGCIEDFLDDFKDAAFRSAFIEPARLYFDVIGDPTSRDHVMVHAVNAYLCLLRGGLGIQMPQLPEEQDQWCFMGLADSWAGLKTRVFEQHFADPQNFGKAFEGITALQGGQRGRRRLIASNRCGRDMSGGGSAGPLDCRSPRDLEHRAATGTDVRLAVFLERFSFFFRPEFLVRRMFEGLNSETKPEHVGFARAAETLYQIYVSEQLGPEEVAETLVEHVYTDDMFTELDIKATTAFFAWLGIVRSPDVTSEVLQSVPGSSCSGPSASLAAGTEQLQEMLGVSEQQAAAALRETDGDVTRAVDVLLASGSDEMEAGAELTRTRSAEEVRPNSSCAQFGRGASPWCLLWSRNSAC